MVDKEFKFNHDIRYGTIFNKKDIEMIKQKIIISSDGKSFKTTFPNIFEKYKLPKVVSKDIIRDWNDHPMKFWQNQLNFAIWCATSGCGIGMKHLKSEGLLGSLFLFHVYYQTRRILREMSIELPQNKNWNAFDNGYDREAFERICREFNVDPNTNFRRPGINNGLGLVYSTYGTPKDARKLSSTQQEKLKRDWRVAGLDTSKFLNTPMGLHVVGDGTYIPNVHTFTGPTTHNSFHIGFIKQEENEDWSTFILDESEGFTMSGIERINESIRIYCWAILGSQSQTRTDILGTGTAFDAQKQFLADVEDAINSSIDLPNQISKYQNVLKYARSKVDFVYGIGLYMSPSNMELQIGTMTDYNNEIVVATGNNTIGVNNDVNNKVIPNKKNAELDGTKTKPPKQHHMSEGNLDIQQNKKPPIKEEEENHEDHKTALIVGSITAGLIIIYFLY